MGASFSFSFSFSFSSKKIPRPSLVDGIPGRGKVVYKKKIVHSCHKKPYTLPLTYPSLTITGIACCPVADETIQAPEATVTEGGVNWGKVHIYLEPTEKGEWGYELAISAEENSETKASQQAGSADGAAAGGDGGPSCYYKENCEEESTSKKENIKKRPSCTIL